MGLFLCPSSHQLVVLEVSFPSWVVLHLEKKGKVSMKVHPSGELKFSLLLHLGHSLSAPRLLLNQKTFELLPLVKAVSFVVVGG